MKIRKTFVPPNDYRPMKKSRKIYLTDAIYAPDINYIGLIIGPKGNNIININNNINNQV